MYAWYDFFRLVHLCHYKVPSSILYINSMTSLGSNLNACHFESVSQQLVQMLFHTIITKVNNCKHAVIPNVWNIVVM